MNNLIAVKTITILALFALLGGCAGIAKAPDHLDKQAKEFKAHPDYSQVYVYRNESFGGAISMPVTIDGELAGTTGPNSFFKFNLLPGVHTITSQEDESKLKITTKRNELYFVWQEVKMGAFSAGSKLQLVNASQGKSGVLESTLIDSKAGINPNK
ncbi:MAG: DUF2846 domain-containing protein [Gammaproteobacteria bacterium]|nr:DUF2846 domain-containing protein [Gammaproteobacteria bacterium]